jgi:putative ABC transport system permease protein
MLGIVIGVAAVIATAAIGSGAKERIQQQIASIGSNIIIIIPGSLTSSGMRMGTGNAVTLTESDARELSVQCPDIALAVPIVRGGAQIVYENSNWATVVYGTTPGFLEVRDISVGEGPRLPSRMSIRGIKWRCWGKRWPQICSAILIRSAGRFASRMFRSR